MNNITTKEYVNSIVSINGSDRLEMVLNTFMVELEHQPDTVRNAFDKCLWELLTIPRTELKSFVDSRWSNNLNKLPVSFLYLIQERVANENG